MNGSYLPATLYRLVGLSGDGEQVYTQIANRLSNLIEEVADIRVDRDNRRELLTLQVQTKDRTVHPARGLSDGTLRFLALAVLELDPQAPSVLCLEEPENGIHPERIPAILSLLQDIAVDVNEPVDVDNPLRQVIINTHSLAVVSQVPDDSLLVAELKETVRDEQYFKRVRFSALPGTWRDEGQSVAKGKLLSYLNPVKFNTYDAPEDGIRRVIDRSDIQQMLLFPENKNG